MHKRHKKDTTGIDELTQMRATFTDVVQHPQRLRRPDHEKAMTPSVLILCTEVTIRYTLTPTGGLKSNC